MKKQLIVILILIAPLSVFAQISISSFSNKNITITPSGITSDIPELNNSTAIGKSALINNISGSNNTAIGDYAMSNKTSGIFNTAIGRLSQTGLLSNKLTNTGSYNTSVGHFSQYRVQNGEGNTSIGYYTGDFLTTGSHNVFMGYYAGHGIETGSRNIMIGSFRTNYYPGIGYSNKLEIGNSETNESLIKGDFSTGELKINSKLKVGGASDIPSATLHVEGNYIISGKTILSSDQHNFNLNGKSVIKVGGVAGINCRLTGIAGGKDGMLLHIYVTQDINFIISNESPLSNVGNRIITGTNTQLEITGDGGVTLIYDGDENVWRVISWIR